MKGKKPTGSSRDAGRARGTQGHEPGVPGAETPTELPVKLNALATGQRFCGLAMVLSKMMQPSCQKDGEMET